MTQFKYLRQVIVILEKFLDEFGGEVIGCTHEEVDLLESMFSPLYHLPNAYKEFLIYGGKEIGKLFEIRPCLSYNSAKFKIEHKYRDIIDMVRIFDKNAQLPPDIFVLSNHLTSYFDYFRLTEGENPAVYFWSEEDDKGMEGVHREWNSFSVFLINEIRICTTLLKGEILKKKLKAQKPPRNRQFWLPTELQIEKGIIKSRLLDYFGFHNFKQLEEVAATCGLESNQYLEELSGWKCRKVTEDNSEIRFFPPEGWQS